MHENDEKCMFQNLLRQMKERDNFDRKRKSSPLVPADDAHIIDTTHIDADELLSNVCKIIEGI